MRIETVSPEKAYELVKQGAELIDIREQDEHRRERIAGARNAPLSGIQTGSKLTNATIVVFHCKSGTRTRNCTPVLSQLATGNLYVLEGGIDAWKKAGLAVQTDKRQPIEMMRQVQIAAGAFALAGAVLGYAVSPAFYALSGAVGAGLMFSGISGTCAMANVLRLMPWNRAAA
jgi:rhodanese-related sulfurtransferase